MADDQTEEVFKRCADNTTVSVELMEGLTEGQSALATLRSKTSDEYYLFDPVSGKVIDSEQPQAKIDPVAS